MARVIKAQLEIDGRKGRASIKKTGRELKNLERVGTGVSKAMTAAFAVATAAIGVAMVVGIKEAIKAASDLQETTSKFNTVFKDQQKLAESWSATLVNGYAMSTEEAKRFLSSVQDLLVPMGMASKAAGKMSFEVVKLAADLGSFNNLPTEQVMLDIQSALVGNFETMKKYGVVLNATVVQEKALAMGLAATKDELTAGMKAQAAYTLSVEGSQAAIGDMARTSGSYANQMKQFKAGMIDLKVVIGKILLPTLTDLVKELNKLLRPMLVILQTSGRMKNRLEEINSLSKNWKMGDFPKTIEQFKSLETELKNIIDVMGSVDSEWLQGVFRLRYGSLTSIYDSLKAVGKHIEFLKEKQQDAVDDLVFRLVGYYEKMQTAESMLAAARNQGWSDSDKRVKIHIERVKELKGEIEKLREILKQTAGYTPPTIKTPKAAAAGETELPADLSAAVKQAQFEFELAKKNYSRLEQALDQSNSVKEGMMKAYFKEQAAELGMSVENAKAAYEADAEAFIQAVKDKMTWQENLLEGASQYFEQMQTWSETMQQIGHDINEVFANEMTASMWDLFEGTKSVEQAMQDLSRSMLKWLTEAIMKELILLAVKKLFNKTEDMAAAKMGAKIAAMAAEIALVYTMTTAYWGLAAAKMAAGAGGGGGAAAGAAAGAMQSGGPVAGGQTYLVGEKGPELFTPASSGQITPNNQLQPSVEIQQGDIVNFVDPIILESYLSTPRGQKAILNVIGRNATTVQKRLMNG